MKSQFIQRYITRFMEALTEIQTDKNILSSICKDNTNTLLKNMSDMYIILDDEFHIKYINQKTCQITKQKRDILSGQHVGILFPKNQVAFLSSLMEEIYLKDKVYNKNTFFKVLGQKSIPVSISLSSLTDGDKQMGYLMIARDNIQDYTINNSLQEKNKELETFVYRVSHDLKGPLASIRGLLELVEKEEEDIPIYKYYVQLIKKSTQKLEATLSGLLEIGLSTNKKINCATFNIKDCIEDIIKSFEGYPGIKNVILLLSVNKELCINTEEKTLRSILQNLIENSIKYRKPNVDDSVTKISARKYKDGIKIKVKDNGQGMDKQVLNKAFDMFFRGNHSAEGSGLGLFIVKSSVQRLGGQLKVNSKVDHGTETWIYLPNKSLYTRKIG